MGDWLPGGSLGGWFMADDGKTDYVHGHVWGVTAKMDLSDSWVLYSGYSRWDYANDNEGILTAGDDLTDWTAGLSWNMAPGLSTKFEYSKYNPSLDNLYGAGEFVVRVTRSF